MQSAEENIIKLEINDIELTAQAGERLIDVADANDISIPRFCYHEKLSVSANCRMCLVEVENVPRPIPACVTAVTDGMKVFTKSPRALAAQKAVMEFLLINHPLDCPICDQGGECDLQDVAMGYGESVSHFSESKVAIADANYGSLVATEMNRCIHCTRCVRFGKQIAGVVEIGGMYRGENMEIGTFVEKSLSSEISGNIIDLCPVGALTSKPFRYKARAWELRSHDGVAAHDSLGSNISIQTRRGQVMRVLPRDNEELNEIWLSDRDRFSYQALSSEDRVTKPMVKNKQGVWHKVEWQEALEQAASGLQTVIDKNGTEKVAGLISPSATTEEHYLLQKWLSKLGVTKVEHRMRQADLESVEKLNLTTSGITAEEVEQSDAVLVVGCNIRHEQPLLAHRVRKAALSGARVDYINPVRYDLNYPATGEELTVKPSKLAAHLTGVAKALLDINSDSTQLTELAGVVATNEQKEIAQALLESEHALLIVGEIGLAIENTALLQLLADVVARLSGAKLLLLPAGANSTGASIVREVMQSVTQPIDDIAGMIVFAVEPELESNDSAHIANVLKKAEFVVTMTPFISEQIEECADIILPISTFAETSGTFVNSANQWQSFNGAVLPPEEARPGWKVLRVLANLANCDDFEYVSSEEVLSELREKLSAEEPNNDSIELKVPEHLVSQLSKMLEEESSDIERVGTTAIYNGDGVVRRAEALQNTVLSEPKAIVQINSQLADTLGIKEQSKIVRVKQGDNAINLPVVIDDRVADDCAVIPSGLIECAELGVCFAKVELGNG